MGGTVGLQDGGASVGCVCEAAERCFQPLHRVRSVRGRLVVLHKQAVQRSAGLRVHPELRNPGEVPTMNPGVHHRWNLYIVHVCQPCFHPCKDMDGIASGDTWRLVMAMCLSRPPQCCKGPTPCFWPCSEVRTGLGFWCMLEVWCLFTERISGIMVSVKVWEHVLQVEACEISFCALKC